MPDNRELTRRWFEEVWNQRRDATIDELLDPEAIIHGLGESRKGPSAFREFHRQFTGAFPDLRVTLDELIADGNTTAVRFTVRATHQGDHLGFLATGRAIAAKGMAFIHWQNGRAIEAWNEFDADGQVSSLA